MSDMWYKLSMCIDGMCWMDIQLKSIQLISQNMKQLLQYQHLATKRFRLTIGTECII